MNDLNCTKKTEKQVYQEAVEKYLLGSDASHPLWLEANQKYGADCEAYFSRLFDKYLPRKTDRKIGIRKWGNITLKAQERMEEDVSENVSSETA